MAIEQNKNGRKNNKRSGFNIKTFSWILAIAISLIVIIFFIFSSNKTTGVSNKEGIQISETRSGEYRSVIKDGKYLVNKARGLTSTSFSNPFSMSSFENGMLEVSKMNFSTDNFIFQEGQTLDNDTITSWLGRKSGENPEGLNPEESNKEGSSRQPMYLQSIEEQDYMQGTEDNLKLSGMTIGLSMNSQDEYSKEQYGPKFYQNISKEDSEIQGKVMAQQVLSRLRKNNKLENTKIVLVMFRNQPEDSLVGGNIYSYAVSNQGDQIDKWINLDVDDIVFPKVDTKNSTGNKENEIFINFKDKVQNFFPNLSGITAQAKYQDDKIIGLHINVTTQFYSSTEVRNFTNYLSQIVPKYFSDDYPIRVEIGTSNDLQSIINKLKGKEMSVVYMDSY